MKIPVYVVSLIRDNERRRKIINDFAALNIDFQFFDAVDAKEPSNRMLLESMRGSGVGDEMTDGEIACTLSHQFIYQDMIDKSYDWVVILEDDVIIDSRFKDFLSSLNVEQINKLKNNNLYLLGGQKGLHEYPVLGLSRFSVEKIGFCKFRRVCFNKEKIRRTCCYLMNHYMALQLLDLTQSYGTYRADSWGLMQQKNIIKDFYLDEIIFHPIVTESNSHLERERMIISKKKHPRTKLQRKMKFLRSWVKVLFFSFFK